MKKSAPILLLAAGALLVGCGATHLLGLGAATAQAQLQPQQLGKTFNLPLLQNGDFAREGDKWWFGGDGRVKASFVPVQNPNFARAVHLDLSAKTGDNPWSAMMTQAFGSPVRSGDTVTLSFWARSPQSAPITVTFEERKAYTKFLTQAVTLSPEWKRYTLQAVAPATYARQEAQLNIWLGQLTGAVEFAGFSASRPIFSEGPDKLATVPAGGVPVIDPASITQVGGDGVGTVSKVSVQGQPFDSAFRVETLKKPANEWDFQFGTWSTAPVKKGDALLASFSVRALKGQAESGEGRLTMQFQSGAPEWAKSISQYIGASNEWKRYDVPFTALRDLDKGQAFFSFPAGFGAQTVEIGGISLLDFGQSVPVDSLPRTRSDYPGQEESAPWRKAANERIEKIRKGDLQVIVQDASGKPVQGAKVEVKMTRHAFGFGNIVDAAFLGQQGADADRYRETLLANYNKIAIENHLKWPFWEASWGRTDGLKAVDWLNAHQLPVIGHNLVWPGYGNLPDDLKNVKDPAKIQARVTQHFNDIIPTLRGKVAEWQVVNEPYAQHDLLDILGRDAMVGWFKQARALDPKTPLWINDYPPLDGAALHNEHLNTYFSDVKMLKDKGAPLDGVGFQCHFGSAIVPPERVLSGLDRFAKLGTRIGITEFDMDTQDEDLQARYMRDFLTATFSHPAVSEIVMWGFWEGKHWLPNGALYRQDWSVKPSGQVWLDLVKGAWWTNASGTSDAKGAYATRGFYGDYTVTVMDAKGVAQTRSFSLVKGQTKPFVVKLS